MEELATVSTLEEAARFVSTLMADLSDDSNALELSIDGFGAYKGLPAQVALLQDGRKAKLLESIEYVQETGENWPVPASIDVDGASIPRLFWSVIGGPFEGLYRDASIVHDHYCVVRSAPWRATHRMFYEAMRCSGVGAVKAKVMFYAVYRFGPRWDIGGLESLVEPSQLIDAQAHTLTVDIDFITNMNPDIQAIEDLIDGRR